jgi:hypothetical protein
MLTNGDNQFHERDTPGQTGVSWGGTLAWAGILGPLWFTTLVILQGFL